MIRTCLFDLGNVLVHFSQERMCAQMGAVCGRSAVEIRELLIDSGMQDRFERGLLSEEEFHRRFEQLSKQHVDSRELRHAACDVFELNAAMVPIVDALKVRGHRLVLFSNTSVSHFDFVCQRFDVLRKFDDYVVSYKVGALKPEPAIFQAALAKIGCEAAECFYTDDVAEHVSRARDFGIEAEVFTDSHTLTGHLEERGIKLHVIR